MLPDLAADAALLGATLHIGNRIDTRCKTGGVRIPRLSGLAPSILSPPGPARSARDLASVHSRARRERASTELPDAAPTGRSNPGVPSWRLRPAYRKREGREWRRRDGEMEECKRKSQDNEARRTEVQNAALT